MARQWRCLVFGRPIADWRHTKEDALADAEAAGERIPPAYPGDNSYITPWTKIEERDSSGPDLPG